MRYISADYVFPICSLPIKNGVICIGDSGQILENVCAKEDLPTCNKIEFYDGILVPGFVNAHCHLELSHLQNVIKPLQGLPEFISSIGKVRKSDLVTIQQHAKMADEQMNRNGIVAVGDVSNTAVTAAVKQQSRIKYHTFVELFGLNDTSAKAIFETAIHIKNEFDKANLQASFSPHAIYSLSLNLWDLLCNANISDIVSIHHHESKDETSFFYGEGEIANMFKKNGLINFDTDISKTSSYIEKYFQKSERILLVHNTFSTHEDLQKYAALKKFYFVICPNSNLYIQNKMPDFKIFTSAMFSNNTCLGTDSLASNNSLSILDEMISIHDSEPHIPLSLLLQWGTLGGARALGFDNLLGSIEKGKTPGINLITGLDFKHLRLTNKSAVQKIV